MTRLSSMTGGFSGFAAIGKPSGPSITVPGAPTIGTATQASSTSVTVSFTAPASNGGATITTYTAVSSPGSLTGSVSQSGSGSITVSGLTSGTAYTFVVYATNSVGNSPNSSSSNSVTPSAPAVGTTFSANSAYYSLATIPQIPVGSTISPAGNLAIYSYNLSSSSTYITNINSSNGVVETTKMVATAAYFAGPTGSLSEDSGGNIYVQVLQGPNSIRYGTTFIKCYANTAVQWEQNASATIASFTTSGYGSPAFDTSGGNVYFALTTAGQSNCPGYVMKCYTSNGAVNYQKVYYGTATNIQISQVAVDSGSNVFVAGSAGYSVYSALYLQKTSSAGAQVWATDRYYTTSSGTGSFQGVTTDGSNVFAVGYTTITNNSGCAVAYNNGGTLLWSFQFPTTVAFAMNCTYGNNYLYIGARAFISSTYYPAVFQVNPSTGAIVAGFYISGDGVSTNNIAYNSTTNKLAVSTSGGGMYVLPADLTTIHYPQTITGSVTVTLTSFIPTTTAITFATTRTSLLTMAAGNLSTATGTFTTNTRTASPAYTTGSIANVVGN